MRGQKDPTAVMEACAKELGVFVRPAKLSDASQLIHLNKHFRYEMMQWEAAFTSSQECKGYPVLDFDDVQYILEEEDSKNLMVIGRRLEVEERIVGYSYSYAEPWEATTDGPAAPCLGIMSPRPNRGKGSRKGLSSSRDCQPSQEKQSLYIAELFISDSERGLGLGELLLTQTLRVHMSESTRSHLFVSSQNVGAVRCYLKFGYQKASKPSGDLAHDLVMELPESQASVLSAAGRFEKQLNSGLLGARKRRPHVHQSTRAGAPSPPKLIGAKTSSAPSHSVSPDQTDSRASSRSTVRGSPDMTVTHCPRPTRGRHTSTYDDIATPQRMTTRTGKAPHAGTNQAHSPCSQVVTDRSNKRSPFMSNLDLAHHEGFHSPLSIIQGRQRKALKLESAHNSGRLLRSRDAKRATRGKGDKTVRKERGAVQAGDAADDDGHQTRNMAATSKVINRFMITLFSDGKRRIAEERIRALGGEIVTSDHYDPRCTHVISARPATTEKYLCAVAAGKYVMHPSYIEDSFKHGAFLPEADFEWSAAVDAMDGCIEDYGMALAKAPELWKPGKGNAAKTRGAAGVSMTARARCFDGMVCVLLSTRQKGEGFRRILEAGGAVVCGDVTTNIRKTSKKDASVTESLLPEGLRGQNKTITHVFVNKDIYEMQSEDWNMDRLHGIFPVLEELHDKGANFLFEEFIVEKIAHNLNMRHKASRPFVIDVESWVVDNQPRVGSKRKATR